ncbi:MAG: 2-oxoacid:acceptor oxidoreductase family protein, partial [Eubacterium sp.]|nr:2-oxoacid:acceptor oxidoreductase family protein [Eubacterium sp.]
GYKGRVVTIDARAISEQTLGKNFPNTPMLAATVAVTKVLERDQFINDMRASFEHKFAKKPEVIDGNMKALEMAYEAVLD